MVTTMADSSALTGMNEVLKKFETLQRKAQRRYAQRAGRAAMAIVRDAARENAKAIDDPETRANISKNITLRTGKIRDKNIINIRVGIQGGASFGDGKTTVLTNKQLKGFVGPMPENSKTIGLPGGDSRHWRFIEFGTKEIAPVPFMRPALYNNIEPVTKQFCQTFTELVEADMSQ